MIKKYLSLIFLFGCFTLAFGQVKIAEVNFEVPTGYSTSILEFTDDDKDYFLRTDGSNIVSEVFTNVQGSFYFAAQDIDGEGATLPVSLILNDIDISGYDNIEFRIHLAEDDDGSTNQDWDNSDYLRITYDLDNTGSFTNLLWVQNDGSIFNSAPFIDTNFDGIGDGAEITDEFTQYIRALTGTGNSLDIDIEFNLDAGDEDIAIDNIEIWGTFAPCSATTTWTSTGWDNGIPDLNTRAILDFAYNTGIDGSIDACNLVINNIATLTVYNNSYVNIKNEINTIGNIIVEPQGSVVQKNDSSINSTTGNITIQKETTILNSPLEYTYWSSPVSGETIENTFANVPASRRFAFDASNFEDLLEEIDNTGAYNFGQDDIDDDGNAWQLASGIMNSGVGYAAMASPFGFFPVAQQFTFEGPFNSGIITVPLINNSSDAYNDWNFIGNPYPSAIDASEFFTINAGVVDALYLWSQATLADANAQGNEGLNFSGADYAVISASGVNIAGGSGDIPDNYIPSGQGFFVEALSAANVTFNNAMRTTGNNNQFFRNTTPLNRQVLWLNLNSDNGVFNQIAVAHIDGATDGNDGTFYDVKRNASSDNFANLYSIINGNDEEFIIQGKNTNSLNLDEVIELGFSSIIEVSTIYTLSIGQFEGDFYESSDIYLKDNLLNTVHNLKDSDYNFTSEVGEFNNRFEIVFRADVLSVNDNQIKPKQLTLIELANGNVEISVNRNITIKTVEILDITGRQIYNLTGSNSTEVYNLSKLSKATYIARVTLSNGQTITKKAIKQN